MKIVIVGGGIGGLSLAPALAAAVRRDSWPYLTRETRDAARRLTVARQPPRSPPLLRPP